MADSSLSAIIRVTADASRAISEFKKLTTEEKKAKEGAEAVADAMSKINLGIGTVLAGAQLLKQALSLNTEVSQMRAFEAALPIGTMERLRQVTGGTVSNTKLLGLAVKGMTGDFKLSADEMGIVIRSAQTLEQRGRGAADAIAEDLLNALIKGGKGLDDLGIEFEKTGNRAKDAQVIIGKLSEIAVPIDATVSSAKRAEAALDNFFLSIKQGAGYAVMGLVQIADTVRWIDQKIGETIGLYGSADAVRAYQAHLMLFDRIDKQTLQAETEREGEGIRRVQSSPKEAGYVSDLQRAYAERAFQNRQSKERAEIDKLLGFGRDGRSTSKVFQQMRQELDFGLNALAEQAHRGVMQGLRLVDQGLDEAHRIYLERMSRRIEAGRLRNDVESAGGVMDPLTGLVSRPGTSAGTADAYARGSSIDAQDAADRMNKLRDSIYDTSQVSGMAMQGFAGSLAAGVDAAITGQESVGKAFKKAAADAMRAIAAQSIVQAAYEAAMALGSLAIGNGAAAATHGAAAAKFAATAALAGAMSSSIGSGSGTPSGGGGGGYGSAGGGVVRAPRAEGTGSTIVVNITGGYYSDANELGKTIVRHVEAAERSGRTRSGGPVEYR